jgi:hypothetical protein
MDGLKRWGSRMEGMVLWPDGPERIGDRGRRRGSGSQVEEVAYCIRRTRLSVKATEWRLAGGICGFAEFSILSPHGPVALSRTRRCLMVVALVGCA